MLACFLKKVRKEQWEFRFWGDLGGFGGGRIVIRICIVWKKSDFQKNKTFLESFITLPFCSPLTRGSVVGYLSPVAQNWTLLPWQAQGWCPTCQTYPTQASAICYFYIKTLGLTLAHTGHPVNYHLVTSRKGNIFISENLQNSSGQAVLGKHQQMNSFTGLWQTLVSFHKEAICWGILGSQFGVTLRSVTYNGMLEKL